MLLFCAALLFVQVSAQDESASPPGDRIAANPDSALSVALAGIAGEPLTLEQAQAAAAAGAVDIAAARAALDEARAALRIERGAFDPELFTDIEHSSDKRLPSSAFSGADVLHTEITQGSAGARLRTPIGTDLALSVNASRTTTNSGFATLDPEFDGTTALTVRQPLLKGFGPAAWSARAAARIRVREAHASFEDVRRAVFGYVATSYWRLYAAERDYAVQVVIVDQGRSLLAQAQARAGVGLVGPGDVANARTFLAEQEQALIDQEENLDAASDALASLIGRRPGDRAVRFRAAEAPPQRLALVDLDPLLAEVLARNPGLQAGRDEMDAVRAQIRGARHNVLPALDVVGAIGSNALAGTPHEVIFGTDTLLTTVHGDFGEVWSQLGRARFPAWSVGLNFSWPIGLRQGRGELERERAQLRVLEHEYEGRVRAIEDAVRAAHRELTNGIQRLASAGEGVQAAQEQVRIGLVQYRYGQTTAFELVRLAADLASAQRRYSQALVRAATAAAQLEYLTAGAYNATGGG